MPIGQQWISALFSIGLFANREHRVGIFWAWRTKECGQRIGCRWETQRPCRGRRQITRAWGWVLVAGPFWRTIQLWGKSTRALIFVLCKKKNKIRRIALYLVYELAYLIPKNWGFSPGAEDSDSLVKDLTWLMDKTVAATNHGNPMTEQMPIKTATIKRSKW